MALKVSQEMEITSAEQIIADGSIIRYDSTKKPAGTVSKKLYDLGESVSKVNDNLPKASTSAYGVVKVKPSGGITISNGEISVEGYNPSGESGVTSVNGITGDVTLKEGTGIEITKTGSEITITNTGGGGSSDDGYYIEYRFQKNTSATTAPSIVTTDRNPSGWSTEQPTSVASGEYIWRTFAQVYTDTSKGLKSNWTGPIRISPVDGTSIRVTKTEVHYGVSTNGKDHTSVTSWGTDIPEVGEGKYLWTRTRITFSDGNTTESYSVTKWGISGSGSSAYTLDLSNEFAGINCDANGNILAGAVRPTCKATLYYGASAITSGVTYSLGLSTGVKGVTIATDGTITFGPTFEFPGTSTEIAVSATYTGAPNLTKIMTISKNYPGANGSPARTYWLTLSADVVRYKTTGCNPSSITAKGYLQIGENTPEAITSDTGVIKYGYDTTTPTTAYSTAITNFEKSTDTPYDYITFKLYDNNGVERDGETVPIIYTKNGLNGAIVRGPFNWESIKNSAMSFQKGNVDEGDKFLDIMYYNNKYYYCKKNWNKPAATTDPNIATYWTESDAQYDFVATNVLWAKIGRIDFLTGNEICLANTNGNVAAGIKYGAANDDIVMYAGPTDTSKLTTSKFYVTKGGQLKATDAQITGTIYATAGTIGGITISGNVLKSSGYDSGVGFMFNGQTNTIKIGSDVSGLDWNISDSNTLTIKGNLVVTGSIINDASGNSTTMGIEVISESNYAALEAAGKIKNNTLYFTY